jgi:glycosyltransferase involved in cell wall biosynthesis
MKCLWIARYMPYPLDAGAKVYSAKLAEALSAAGATVRFLGYGSPDAAPRNCGVEYVSVGSSQRSQFAAIVSHLPIAAAIDATSEYASLLEEQLRAEWDAIVLDGYGSGWALSRCLDYVAEQGARRTVIVHVSHNHEASVWRAMAREARGSFARRFVLWQNALKVHKLERRIVSSVDLLTAICDEDLAALQPTQPSEQLVTLTPGYEGPMIDERTIDAGTPRRVVVVGSFRWVMKQENLSRFVTAADPVLHERGVHLDIVGDVPDELLSVLRPRCHATTFHGFVADTTRLLAAARIAIVPELIGGGFKLKFLDYFFGRVPVATLSAAAAGLPAAVRPWLLESHDMEGLVKCIVDNIDDIDVLNELQFRAFQVARSQFRWEDRGARLKHAIGQLQHRWLQHRQSVHDTAKACTARPT